MLESIRNHAKGWLAYVIVILISIPFALWGIGDYLGYTKAPSIASVNGEDISEQTFLRFYQQLRTQDPLKAQETDAASETALKKNLLEELIAERLQVQSAQKIGFYISDHFITGRISRESIFQSNGKFSRALFERWLQNNDFTEQSFIKKIKESFLAQQTQNFYHSTAFVTPLELEEFYQRLNQKRDVLYAIISKERFQNKVTLSEEALHAFYEHEQNSKLLSTEEEVALEYLELSALDLPTPQVNDDEVKKHFEENVQLYAPAGQSKIAHLLLLTPNGKITHAVSEKITGIQKRLKQGESFEKLVYEFSEDAATKNKKGILGWFTEEELPPDLAKAAFKLKSPGELSEPVQTSHGVHILKLVDKKTTPAPSFDSLAQRIKSQLEQEKRTALFFEKRDELAEKTYEHPNDLTEAGASLGLTVKTSPFWSQTKPFGIFSIPKLKQAAFSAPVLQEKINSEVIEIEPEHVVVLRIKEHKPSTLKPYDEVKSKIAEELTLQQKSKFAEEFTKTVVQQLNQTAITDHALLENKVGEMGKHLSIEWKKQLNEGRFDAHLAPPIRTAVFDLPAPQYKRVFRSVPLESGDQAIVAILHDTLPLVKEISTAERDQYRQLLEASWGRTGYALFIQDFKSKAKIKRKLENL
ncbi:MAG: SurA N-terminal domain-containing protein [Gammaproteobacteria bacterium]|nr:SurA N-terminal domain-containing protein [Gammaproteobacteria bacterium]